MRLLKRLRSFQRGTVGFCRVTGVKITSCQSWRFEKNPAPQPAIHHAWAACVWIPDERIILKTWQTSTLEPFDPQYLFRKISKKLSGHASSLILSVHDICIFFSLVDTWTWHLANVRLKQRKDYFATSYCFWLRALDSRSLQ